jgi:16S rRNA (cytidine1402-2'-O)-methyltransferase
MAGTLFVVATPIGNLEDITIRALRVLREVAVIAAEDTRRTAHLLARHAIATRTTSLHEHNERGKTSALIARLEAGESIALVSDAGTPTVSDPGVHLISSAVAHGIRVEAIPGPNAAIAALSVSGIAVDTFAFLGFPPTKSKDRKMWFDRLRQSAPAAIFYEAPHRIERTLEEIQAKLGDLQVVIARELTKSHEELVRGPISTILARGLRALGEFTVIVMLGQLTDNAACGSIAAVADDVIVSDFGRLTITEEYTRRQAIAAISRKYGISAKHTYRVLEAAKDSGS